MIDRCAITTMLLLAWAGCKPNGELGGSIADGYDLHFDRVRSYWLADDLVVIYEKDYAMSSPTKAYGDPVTNQIARITFQTDKQALEVGEDIPYQQESQSGLGITVLRYVLKEESGSVAQGPQFPEVLEAEVHFDKLSRTVDKSIKGEFEVTFIDDRFLWGTFDSTASRP